MSRIGNQPISIPAGVTVTVKESLVTVKGPKGELSQEVNPDMIVEVNEGQIDVKRPSESKKHRAQHGLYRSLINNMVEGVANGYVRKLELVGVGYRATNQGQILELSLGYSHPILMQMPPEIKVEAVTDRKSNPIITLESADKQLLGQICAKIRAMRKPEPYKGKGIKFVGEQIRRKAGKSAKV
ncbi:large subunit ribosomal protein L6 [Saccharicrinis carchari]|uniref:Large ribosomal subunit protein uL6 n=1 Tax=Saccharicrinis carchari TaxID=1168039 RepID=A0A521EUE5_SACCC|nr:50S ribosomal protein L6 [Saccharicrinis carchari]SMO87576.1 large subunit ribosomal protein L6 [Saccharicrinis carchari]